MAQDQDFLLSHSLSKFLKVQNAINHSSEETLRGSIYFIRALIVLKVV